MPSALLYLIRYGLLLGTLALAACTDGKRGVSSVPASDASPALRLALLTDLAGYLEPCGCQSRPLGGVDRLATELAKLRQSGEPVALLAAGQLFVEPRSGHAAPSSVQPGAGGPDTAAQPDHREQARLQAEALAQILGQLQCAALTPSPEELAGDKASLAVLSQATGGAWLVANPPEPAPDFLRSSVLMAVGDVRLGVVGASLPSGAVDREVEATREQLSAAVAELRRQGADLVVGLMHAERRTTRRLSAVDGLDFVLQGGLDQAEAAAPAQLGSSVLLHAGRHGQGLLVLDVYLPRTREQPIARWRDVSEWTRRVSQEAVQRRADDLAARIAEWEKDQQVDPTQLAQQRGQLAELRRQADALGRPASPSGASFRARWVELGPEVPQDPEVRSHIQRHDRQVNELNRAAFASLAPPSAPPGSAVYVGAERCGACHAEALTWWRGHAHGRAYATLVERHKQYNLSCVGCHVTGYQQPGGAAVVQNEGLTDVGCESCHGPGSLHAADPAAPGQVARQVPESLCLQCHNPEHSDRFHYPTYKAMLMAPGHGRPMPDGRPVMGQREAR